MKLMVSSYNNGAVDWNAEFEETAIRSYRVVHEFGKPARVDMVLADPTGILLRKYTVDDNDVYIGVGKITLEDPTGTDFFYGRILKAAANFKDRTLILTCADWLHQLTEDRITYDMREKLGTTDLRQSTLRSDMTNLTPASNVAGTYYVYDDGPYDAAGDMGFVNDAYNGMYFILTVGMAGKKTWRFYPYKGVDAGGPPTYADDYNQIWWDGGNTGNNYDRCFDNADFTLVYTFAAEIGHNTPSDFYVHDSISSAKIYLKYKAVEANTANHIHIEIYNNDTAAYEELKLVYEESSIQEITMNIPTAILPYLVDASGEINLRFNADVTGGSIDLFVYHLYVELTTETTGYSSAVTINDTINPNKLEVATDMTAAATQVWEQIPYCIAKPIYKHIDSVEDGRLITDAGGIGGDADGTGPDPIILITSAANIEHTTGISTRQYKDKTYFEILTDLAEQDKAVFWMPLGTHELYYKKTFGADTATLTDADVDTWQSIWDYETMFNKVIVRGVRIGDYEISQSASDATSIAKFLATRTKIVQNTGVVSDYDALTKATTIVTRDAMPQQMVACELTGFDTTHRLGTIVEITSSYLWSAAANDYVVYRWAYDSTEHKTYLLLHPKSSIGYQHIELSTSERERIDTTIDKQNSDTYIADPVTHEVA